MPRHPDFEAAPREPILEPFRQSVGQLVLDGEVAGLIATQVDSFATRLGGWLWWSRWAPAREFLMVLVTAASEDSPLPEYEDPWLFVDENAETIESLQAGRWEEPDRRDPESAVVYEIRWLAGPEREAAWAEHGFDPLWEAPRGQELL